MLDVGWTELMVIGVLALLVVGPKELPRLMRTVGQFVAKARGMAREFQRSMEDAAREADLSEFTDLKRDLDRMGRANYRDPGKRVSTSPNRPAAKPAGLTDRAGTSPTPSRPATPPTTPASEAEQASVAGDDPAPATERKAASGER